MVGDVDIAREPTAFVGCGNERARAQRNDDARFCLVFIHFRFDIGASRAVSEPEACAVPLF